MTDIKVYEYGNCEFTQYVDRTEIDVCAIANNFIRICVDNGVENAVIFMNDKQFTRFVFQCIAFRDRT
jgi:hypothetical protein